MLDAIASSTLGFWICALAIVLIDSAALLKAGEFAFRLRANGGFDVRLPRAPFLVRNHELVFTLVTYFVRPFHLSSISSPAAQADKLTEVQQLDAPYRALSLFAATSLALIVLAGPLVSLTTRIEVALFAVVPLLYGTSIAALTYVFVNKGALRMTNSDWLRFAFELLACPVLAVNIVKRLTMRRTVVLNTWALVGEDAEIRNRIDANLELFDTPLSAR